MKKKFTNEEIESLWAIYHEFRDSDLFDKLYGTQQHRSSNTYRHVCMVTRLCIRYVIKHHWICDYRSLIRGAFLHDYFFYDWRKDKSARHKHLTDHPRRAYENAIKLFDLTPIEKDIILNHMWPVTITKFPKSKEAKLVSWMDKVATVHEFFTPKKELIIFDLDGTVLDTSEDLLDSINYILKKYNYPLVDKEHVRKSLGNGLKMFFTRCLPKDVPFNNFMMMYNEFVDYYSNHSDEKTKPYPEIKETLIHLRRGGFRTALCTNKKESVAQELADKYFPNLFLTVCGDDGKRKLKPSADPIREIMKRLKIKRRSRIAYVGDSETDYKTARNARISCLLATYGFRTEEELRKSGVINVTFLQSPADLKTMYSSLKK